MQEAGGKEWKKLPIGQIVEAVAVSFLGAPYVAHSLEGAGEEQLIVNLRAFDCTTFVESTLALSRCIKRGTTVFQDFRAELQRLRYRAGVLNGYASRLHYFIDWVDDNAAKGILRDVTGELGGVPFTRKIDYMSSHPAAYRQLADEQTLRMIRAREDSINARGHDLLPALRLPSAEEKIRTGDIIGIVTDEPGSDVSHIGYAVHRDGVLRFLHAPLSRGRVEIAEGTLAEYLRANKRRSGVIVARPLEP
jgi:hypothetical protein